MTTSHAAPALHPGWYILCRAAELRRTPLRLQFCGQPLVAFRDGEGTIDVREDGHHVGAQNSAARAWVACEWQSFVWIKHELPPEAQARATPGLAHLAASWQAALSDTNPVSRRPQ
jgi:phenylpropionate dioxygenase-like ring-hydroxylating dioxygenase large terminal subunit